MQQVQIATPEETRWVMSRRSGGRRFSARGGGGPPITPKTIFGSALKWWLRADLGVTVVGSGVDTWADQSGVGDANQDARQTTDGNRPPYNASDAGYNGQATLSFDGATKFMATGTWTTGVAQPYTVFVVGNDSGAVSAQIYVEGGSDGSGTNRAISFYNNAANYETFAGVSLAAGGGISNAKRAGGAVVNGASSALYNSAKTPVASGNAGTNTPFKFGWIGQSFAASARLNGKMAEVVLLSGAAAASQLNALLDYFGARYAFAIGA